MNNNMTTNEIKNAAFEAVFEKLGAHNFIRFIEMFDNGYGDYTEERRNTINDKTIDSIANEIYKNRSLEKELK